MTERVDDTTISTESMARPDLGAGARLKRAREAAGMHVGALAVMLKVPVHRLEALESERWDLLPDAVFVRALAGSVCRALKVDATPVLEKLPNPTRQPVAPDDGLNAPFRAAQGQGPVTLAASQLTRPLVLAVLALLLGAVVLVFLPWFQRLASPTPVGSDRTAALPAPMATVDKAASTSAEPVPDLGKRARIGCSVSQWCGRRVASVSPSGYRVLFHGWSPFHSCGGGKTD
jgi:cytoskeleton protein RodZ